VVSPASPEEGAFVASVAVHSSIGGSSNAIVDDFLRRVISLVRSAFFFSSRHGDEVVLNVVRLLFAFFIFFLFFIVDFFHQPAPNLF